MNKITCLKLLINETHTRTPIGSKTCFGNVNCFGNEKLYLKNIRYFKNLIFMINLKCPFNKITCLILKYYELILKVI